MPCDPGSDRPRREPHPPGGAWRAARPACLRPPIPHRAPGSGCRFQRAGPEGLRMPGVAWARRGTIWPAQLQHPASRLTAGQPERAMGRLRRTRCAREQEREFCASRRCGGANRIERRRRRDRCGGRNGVGRKWSAGRASRQQRHCWRARPGRRTGLSGWPKHAESHQRQTHHQHEQDSRDHAKQVGNVGRVAASSGGTRYASRRRNLGTFRGDHTERLSLCRMHRHAAWSRTPDSTRPTVSPLPALPVRPWPGPSCTQPRSDRALPPDRS